MKDKKVQVAIQLYSLHTIMGKDVPGNLRKLADMGYTGVELAGTYDLPPKTLRKMLDDCKLQCVGAHVGLDAFSDSAIDKTIAMAKDMGTDRLIVPWAEMKDLPKVIDQLKAAHARAKKHGIRVGYHNHAHEFEVRDGKTCMDMIVEQTPADFLIQLDIGWAAHASQDLPATLRRYGKRMETVHVKEFSKSNPTAVVGEGDVKWPPLLDILEASGVTKWYVIEQENYAIGPMESAKGCIDNMKKMGR